MEQAAPLCFGPFRLDPVNEQVWRGKDEVPLGSKAFALLHYLARHPGRLIRKEELLKEVWAGTHVTNTVLKVHVHAIRQALGEEADAPRYIETVPRLGYRFVGGEAAEEADRATAVPRLSGRHIVGREAEVEQLHAWLTQALHGERRVVFITGEPGIGKTSLVETFLARLAPSHEHGHEHEHDLWIGRGQCLEQYGEGEAYLPVLEALGQLCRGPGGERVLAVLHQYAPTWLVQMAGLVTDAELEVLQQRVHGATRERMLREMAEAIDALAREQPLMLIFEDLHWSDRSTLELLAYLAQRRQRARLLIIGTYRPADVVASDHPLKSLKQELHARNYCDELPLELLTEDDISAYLAARLGIKVLPIELGTALHQQTEGNPLFMVNVVEYCLQQGALHEVNGQWELKSDEDFGVPESLRQLIARQIERLQEDEQRVLEMASVAGMEFAAASVAAGLNRPTDEVEEACETLAWRGHFLQETGLSEWPDGTVSGRYAFRHALYQNVLYERIAPARRVRFHRTIGEREEGAYGDHARTIAAALARHFERGHEYQRAVHYRRRATETALRRNAYQEAAAHCATGLALLPLLPDTPERTQLELSLQMTLGVVLAATKGYAAAEVERAYLRARELCEQVGEPPQLLHVLRGLTIFYTVRANFQTARQLGEQFLSLAQRAQDSALLELANMLLGTILLWLDELAAAQAHFVQGAAFSDPHQDPQRRRDHAVLFGQDPGITLLCHAAWVLWLLGYPDQALQRSQEALCAAQELSHSYSLAFALTYAAGVRQFRREAQAAQQLAEATIALSSKQGFRFLSARGISVRGWVLAEQGQVEEGSTQMRQSLAIYQALGTERGQPHFLAVLAEACGKAGQREEGLILLAKAQGVLATSGERWWEAELYRLRGELTLQSGVQSLASRVKKSSKFKVQGSKSEIANPQALIPNPQAEAYFLKAIEVARRQSAKSLELRAAVSMSRLWQQQSRTQKARQLLTEIYNWFTEGFDTTDLKEAKTLLDELR